MANKRTCPVFLPCLVGYLCAIVTLGAVTAISVSWMMAVMVDPIHTRSTISTFTYYQRAEWTIDEFRNVAHRGIMVSCVVKYAKAPGMQERPPAQLVPRWLAGKISIIQPGKQPAGLFIETTGWPFQCLSAFHELYVGANYESARMKSAGGIVLWEPGWTSDSEPNIAPITLPYHPIWPGLIYDVLFYSLLWCLVFGAMWYRRTIRHCSTIRRSLEL